MVRLQRLAEEWQHQMELPEQLPPGLLHLPQTHPPHDLRQQRVGCQELWQQQLLLLLLLHQ